MTTTRSTCPYCGVGCGVLIESEGARITGVRGDPDHPANFGKLCTKGSTLHMTATQAITHQTRLLQPMQRRFKGDKPEAMSWDAAMDLAVSRLAGIASLYGPDAIGIYISGQLLTEDYYVFNKLAKGLLGTNNVDTNSRLCMSSAVAGYKATLGADAPPACYDDVNHAQCLFIVGSNTAFAHPILFRRIEEARKRNPEMKVIVADPRRTDTAELADLYLPIQPGSDIALFHGMLHLMLWEGWVDQAYIDAHTEGFADLKALVREYTPAHVSRLCGITEAQLQQATQWFARSGATLSLYCQGLNQSSSGTAKNASLINLHLATGQIGKPGAGPFSLTGQPNAMGGREVGGLANLLSAHRDMANPAHRAEIAALWGVPSVPDKPGKTAMDMFQAAADGEIKALWIACTNPAQSLPDQAMVRRALERAEFVIVQEAFATSATCAYADLLLPASTWGEKEGTVTNSERRITRVRAAVPPAGEARHDWRIVVDIGRRMQERLRPELPPLFPYEDTESIWLEHRESTRGRDLDITGMSYALLEEKGPQFWPMPEGASEGRDRLYADGVFPTPSGKARFASLPWKPLSEPTESRFPFSLTTGRLRDQWHGMTRTGTLGRLFGHVPEPVVELNGGDMERRGIKEGDLVYVTSKRGSVVLPAQASAAIAPSQAFVAMHWGSEYLSGRSGSGAAIGGINAITNPTYCPTSKQPELKHSAVKVLKADLPWQLMAVGWMPPEEAHARMTELRQLMPAFEFATCVPFGRDKTGVLFRGASHDPVDEATPERIETLFGLNAPQVLRYADKRLNQRRRALFDHKGDDIFLKAVLLAGDISASNWINTLIKDELPATAYGRLVLMPGSKAPVAVVAKGKEICSCFGVSEDAIAAELTITDGSDEQRLGSVQAKLKCGTNCGSCLPELRRIVQLNPARKAA